jgi:hypothetical protein
MPFLHRAIHIDRKLVQGSRTAIRLWSVAVLLASASLGTTAALAAGGAKQLDADAYQRERAACLSGQSNQDRTTCLREAGAARDEARRGHLDDGSAQYEKNALTRCNTLPQDDRQACRLRMQGAGSSQGSVAAGGIIREIAIPEPAPSTSASMQDSPASDRKTDGDTSDSGMSAPKKSP